MKRLALCCLLLLAASSCSRKSDEELYREGLAAERGNDHALALERYAESVALAPASAYAESSQYHAALLLMNMEGEKRRAVAEQLRFHDLFPASPNAPSMLFLAAFTCNNDLHAIDSARTLYARFLERYPGDKLAASARFELENLGKSPEEFIRAQQAGDSVRVSAR